MLTLFERAFIAHLVADWLLQNDWMARNKTDLRHPAGWVHAAIYGVALALVLDWRAGLVLAGLHLLVDTRIPRSWWQKIFRQTSTGPVAVVVGIWDDQVIHLALIAAWIAIAT